MGIQLSQGTLADEYQSAHNEYKIGWNLSTTEYRKRILTRTPYEKASSDKGRPLKKLKQEKSAEPSCEGSRRYR